MSDTDREPSVQELPPAPPRAPAPVDRPPFLPALRGGGGQLVGWGLVAVVNVCAIALGGASGAAGASDRRVLHYAFAVGQLVFAGAVSAALVAAWEAWGPRARWAASAAVVAAGVVVGAYVLSPDLTGLVGRIPGPRAVVLGVLVLVAALALAAIARAGGALSGRRWPIAAAVGLGLAIANHEVLNGDYPGIHLFVVWSAAVLAGAAVAVRGQGGRRGAIVIAVAAVLSAPAAVVRVPNAVAVELMRGSGEVLAPWLRQLRTTVSRAPVPAGESAWFADRSRLPDVPPSAPPIVPRDGIVLLLTIDAFRTEVLGDAHAAKLPAITDLRRRSVDFTAARVVASSTTASIGSIFTSRYYSSLYWTQPDPKSPNIAIPEDPAPRFPELLSKGGVRTLNLSALGGLITSFGLVGHFDEEQYVRGPQFAGADQLLDALMKRLAEPGVGPFFAFAHMIDAHAPYTRRGVKGTPYQRYLAGVEFIDEQLGRLFAFLVEHHLDDRTTIILSADHGEAFGEHETYYHAVTVYDELMHVPLLVRVPGVAPKVVTTPVSHLDLGPTILDLFGQPTPASFMGQSLVGFLRAGPPPTLTRPLAGESSRKMKMMLFPDGMKLIFDPLKRTVELYDIARDPGELKNLTDDPAAHADERLDTLEAFFGPQTLHRPGYEVPYFAH